LRLANPKGERKAFTNITIVARETPKTEPKTTPAVNVNSEVNSKPGGLGSI
jgi:hypothetical protein